MFEILDRIEQLVTIWYDPKPIQLFVIYEYLFFVPKHSTTADQSNRTVLVMYVGASFFYKFLARVSPLLGKRILAVNSAVAKD